MALRPTWQMTDEELIAEAQAIDTAEDAAALANPSTLLRRVLPTYRRRPHARLIAREVARLGDGDGDRLMILTPPQVGKTLTAVVGGAYWWLCRRPAHRVIIGSHSNALAINRGRSIRKLVIEHGHRYGLRLEPGSQAVNDWELTTGGGVKSVGIGAGVAGSPGDFAIIDDPHKSRAEAGSLRRRDTVHDWYSADLLTRLSPGAPVLLIMTPWHPDDLRARLLADEGREEDGGRWRVVAMPALCTDPDRDPLGRKLGDPLPHPKIALVDVAAALRHWEDKRRSSTVRDWHALYQLDPKPVEGALLTRELLRQRRCYQQGSPSGPCDKRVKRAAVAVDPSGGGRDTAGVVGGYLAVDGRLYYTHDHSGRMPSDQWARKACELAVELDADRIICETNFGGDVVLLAIRTAWDVLRREELDRLGGEESPRYRKNARYARLCPRIVGVRAKKNKLLRAEPVAQQWVEDRIRTGAYLPEFEEEWATWQPDQKDSPGRIDAGVYLAYGLLKPPSAGSGGVGAPPTGQMPVSGPSPLAGTPSGGGPFGSLG